MFGKLNEFLVKENAAPVNVKITGLDSGHEEMISKESKLQSFLSGVEESKSIVTIAPAANYGGDFMSKIKEESQKRVAQAESAKKEPVASEESTQKENLEIENRLNGFKKVVAETDKNELNTDQSSFEAETQIAAEIENTFKKGVKATQSIEQIIHSPSVFTGYKLEKLKKQGGDIAEIANIVQSERNLLLKEMSDGKDIMEMNRHVEALVENIQRSKAKIKELNTNIENANGAANFIMAGELADKLKLEARAGTHSQEEISDLQIKIAKFQKNSGENTEKRRFDIAISKSNLESKQINFDKVIKALAGIKEIQNKNDEQIESLPIQKRNLIGAILDRSLIESSKKTLNTLLSSEPIKRVMGLLSRMKNFIDNQKNSSLPGSVGNKLNLAAIAGLAMTASVANSNLNDENIESSKRVQPSQVEIQTQKQIPVVSSNIQLSDDRLVSLKFTENKVNEVQEKPAVNIDKISLFIENNPKQIVNKDEGHIKILRRVISKLKGANINEADMSIKKQVANYMSQEKIKPNEENFNSVLDSILTKIMLSNKKFTDKFTPTKYTNKSGKESYRFGNLTPNQEIDTSVYLDLIQESLSIDLNK